MAEPNKNSNQKKKTNISQKVKSGSDVGKTLGKGVGGVIGGVVASIALLTSALFKGVAKLISSIFKKDTPQPQAPAQQTSVSNQRAHSQGNTPQTNISPEMGKKVQKVGEGIKKHQKGLDPQQLGVKAVSNTNLPPASSSPARSGKSNTMPR